MVLTVLHFLSAFLSYIYCKVYGFSYRLYTRATKHQFDLCMGRTKLLLNTLKCCYLLFSRKPTPTLPSSFLLINNTVLRLAKEFKYLGVTFSSDASWIPHINTICLKTRKLVGMLFWKFYCHIDSHSLLKLYLSTVRPHLEYASSVWDPYLKKNIEAIEHVQKFALKFARRIGILIMSPC